MLRHGSGFFQLRNGGHDSVLLFFNLQTLTWQTVLELPYHMNNLAIKGDLLYIASEYGYWVYGLTDGHAEQIAELTLVDGSKLGTDCNTLTFDRQGGMWIGTEKRGVLYARPHSVTFRSYNWSTPQALEYDQMMDSLEQNIQEYLGKKAYCKITDSRGWSWIGTQVGLYLDRPDHEEVLFTKQQGLNNNVVHSVIEDQDHNIWIATSCGITFFLIRDGEVAFINNFTLDDNVPNESFENSKAIMLNDGSIAMKAVNHVVVFNPSELTEVNNPHLLTNIKPKLIRLLVNGDIVEPLIPMDNNVIIDRALTRVEHINLKSDQNSISLVFAALNYFRPTQIYYRVRVYEKDNKWTVFASFTSSLIDDAGILHYPLVNLEPGDYHVEVQSSMFPDIWEEDLPEDKRFVWKIHVHQPWWRTTGLFFLVGAVLLILLFVNFAYYIRNTRMRDERNNKEGDIIRKIRFFVERCESLSSQPLMPTQKEIGDDRQQQLDPEFIDLMTKIMPYVNANQNRTLTMHKISEQGDVDIVKLYEILANNLHKDPRDLNKLVRLNKAEKLLKETDKSIEEIAKESGFYTPNYFLGNFFHKNKMTPTEFREQNSQKD